MKQCSSLPVIVVGTGGVARSLVHSLKLNNIRIIGVITRGGRESEEYISEQELAAISYGAKITEPCVCILSVPDRLVAETAQKNRIARRFCNVAYCRKYRYVGT